jgi:hypothetical protein
MMRRNVGCCHAISSIGSFRYFLLFIAVYRCSSPAEILFSPIEPHGSRMLPTTGPYNIRLLDSVDLRGEHGGQENQASDEQRSVITFTLAPLPR